MDKEFECASNVDVNDIVSDGIELVIEPIEEPEMESETEIEPEVESVEAIQTYIGHVVDCPKLNVRKAPDVKAQILCVVDRNAEVEIDESESTDYFYKIYLANGIEGFCMKQFIAID